MTPSRILFMGSPLFAVASLSAILGHSSVNVVAVVTQPDQPKGRGKQVTPTAVNLFATERGIPVFTPKTKRGLVNVVETLQPDMIVVVAYGRLLPAVITDKYVCLNVHGSLLPQYRGASPIHAALMNGDKLTGVTLIQMNEKMDEGPILSMSSCDIADGDSFQTLHDRLSEMGGQLLTHFFNDPKVCLADAVLQNVEIASYCQKLTSEDALLTSDRSAVENWGRVRAFSPVPGAYLIDGGKRIKIIDAVVSGEKLTPLVVKPEGKSAMSYEDYKRGRGPLSFFE
jgi:methionyl-tRNA formyltransferase